MLSDFVQNVLDPARVAALRRLHLLDTPADESLDKLAELASRFFKVPVALVTLVDDTRQFFKACRGLPEPWGRWRESPLSHSFCKHVVANDAPLVVPDARKDPLLHDNLGIDVFGVVAYLGIPLRVSGQVIGSFCIIDRVVRNWTTEDVELLTLLSHSVLTALQLRTEITAKENAITEVHRLNCKLMENNEELAAANEETMALNYTLAHDLRAPLRAIVSFAELAQTSMAEEREDYLERIRCAARRMHELLDGVQDLALPDRTVPPDAVVNLSHLAEEIARELAAAYPQAHVKLEVTPGLVARGDERLLWQLLYNLLGNAWKFTADRPDARVWLGLANVDGTLAYFVRDNGCGFPMRYAQKIFNRFERLDPRKPGSGVGLAVARKIVLRHGGRIWADSMPDHGATFYFTVAGMSELEPQLPRPTQVELHTIEPHS